MAEPNDPIPAAPAPASPAASAPAAPVAVPVIDAAPAAPPAPAPPAEAVAAPVADAKAAEAAAPAAQPSLLEKFDAEAKAKEAEKPKPDAAAPAEAKKPDDKKPADAKAADAAKPDAAKPEAAKSAEPAKLDPVEYKYKLPETLTLDDAGKTELHGALDEFRSNPIEGAQKLVDLHEKRMRDYDAHLRNEQVRVFNETRGNWNKEILADPIIGGAGHQTAMGAIARMRDLFVPESRRAEFNSFLTVTGAGDHPAFMHLLHEAARYFDEPAAAPPNAKPTANGGQRPNARVRDLYKTAG